MVLSGYDVLLLFLFLNALHGFCMQAFYKKAGHNPFLAFAPFYNVWLGLKLIKKPVWWVFLFFIPVINNVMVAVLWVGFLRSFGFKKSSDYFWTFATLGLYFFALGRKSKSTYNPIKRDKSTLFSSLIFAIVVATVIRFFLFEPYTIPTSSMEKTLRVGDFLFVNKYIYGARIPMTLLSLPLLHDKVPILDFFSYVDWLQLPYFRLPAFKKVERYDIIVFNYPVDDFPLDKKQNYVKRCVAIPGDTLEVRAAQLYINGEKSNLPPQANEQFTYEVNTRGIPLNFLRMRQRYEITDNITTTSQYKYNMPLSREVLPFFKKFQLNLFTLPESYRESHIFSKKEDVWNGDHYGPIYIPKEGDKIQLTTKNLPLYRRLIEKYEGHTLTQKGEQIYIDGVQVSVYQTEKNYYWAMGDNRSNSLDSRYWGFVPEDHIFGSPSMIWMSWNAAGQRFFDKIRWDRLFLVVDNESQYHMYIPFGVLLLGLFFFNRYRKKRLKSRKKEEECVEKKS